ncbi:MAG: hypothetical protein EAZ97_02880, partial [Bacteroidetes bacterium]
MIRKIWLLAMFCLCFLGAQAQIGKFLKLETFEQDVDFWLQKSSDTITTEIAPDFKSTYQNFNEKQRERIFKLSSEMFKRGLSPVPHISSFWACVVYGVKKKNFSADQTDNFLDVAEKTAEGCKFRLDLLTKFLYTSRLFLRDGYIYRSRFNQLVPDQNVKFKFGHVFFDEIAPAPLPSQQEAQAAPEPIQEVSPVPDDYNWDSGEGWDHEHWASAPNNGREVVTPVVSAEDSLAILKAKEEQPIFVKLPKASGPYIVFEKTDLIMASIYDTMIIKNTEGTLLLFEDEWLGKGGQVNWQNLKLSPQDVFADFLEYSFDVRSARIVAQNAKLTYASKIKKPVLGVYEYQSNRGNRLKNANFPRFMSYDSKAKIDNVLPDVNFIGGFSLVGKNISSKNISGNPSIIEVHKQGVLKFRATTFKDYIFNDSSVIGKQASVSVFFNQGKDSIYHLGSQLLYDSKKSILNARKDIKEYNRSPFTDSYHKVDITADHLKWELSKNVIDISIKSAYLQVPAIVESLDYFDKDRFSNLQGMSRYHPLMAAVNYAKVQRVNSFLAIDLAKSLQSQEKSRSLVVWHTSIRQFMAEMHRYGYLKFNPKTDEITLLDKGVLYARAVNNKADFDKIQISSQVELDSAKPEKAKTDSSGNSQTDSLLAKKQILKFAERNIILDLTNNDLIINGVNFFPVRLRDEEIQRNTKYVLSKRSLDELKDELSPDQLRKLNGFVKNKNQFQKDKDFYKVLVDSLGEETVLAHKDAIFYAARPDVLDIFVIPTDKKIVMKKNRDFSYDGVLYANGFAHFYGKEFMFKYDSFKVDMPTIDSLAYIVKNDTTGKLEPMSNKILGASGTLLIANPKNKSGLRDEMNGSKKYPIMNFTKGGDIAFSDTKILGGENVYADTSKFKFNAKPYRMDDIARHDPKNLKLEGELKTSIFPTLDEPMQVRADGSFGFVHQILPDHKYPDGRTFPKGLPMYEDSSKTEARTAFYNGEIKMDNKGMRGTGEIKYLNATLESNDFIFYPDSVTALSKHVADTLKSKSKGTIASGMVDGVSFPDVAMENLKLQWMVKKDSMVFTTTKKAFDMYHIPSAVIQKDQKSTFTGALILAPQLVGRGVFENAGSKVSSKRFAFEQNIFKAKEADMEIKSEGGEPAVLAKN